MTTMLVSTVDELYAALNAAEGGDVIELAAGNYEKIALWEGLGINLNFDAPVTIRSADPENQAVIRQLEVKDASNIVFDSLTFDYVAETGASIMKRPFQITESSFITVQNSTFNGDLAEGVDDASDGFGTGIGLAVRQSSDVVVENNEFFNWYKGLAFGGGTDYVARGNDIHSIRGDGLTVTKSQGVLIEDNYIHDFIRNLEAGDHSDMIQFWTNGNTEAITDVIIRNNVLDIGDGDHTQSIFMRNEAVDVGGGYDMFYKNIEITDNLIINAHLNGIVLGATDGLILSGNTLLHSDGGSPRDVPHLEMPFIRLDSASLNVEMEGNVAGNDLIAGNDTWTLLNNRAVQDIKPEADGYYEHFTDLLSPAQIEALVQGLFTEETLGSGAPAPLPVEAVAEDPALYAKISPLEALDTAYHADFADLADDGAKFMRGGVTYDAVEGSFDMSGGKGDAVILGKLNEYRDTDQITVSMSFNLDSNEELGQLFNNHMRLSMAVSEGSLELRVATEDEGFKRYDIDDLDLALGEDHRLTLSLDRADDRLQVVLDGEIILEDTSTNFVARDGMHNWGWTLGNHWHDSIDGTIGDFALIDTGVFLPDHSAIYDSLLLG